MLLALRSLYEAASGGNITVTGSQTLAAVTQTTTVAVTDAVSASQTLANVTQTTTVSVTDQVSANQTLPAVTQTASAGVVAAVSASQTLQPVAQTATVSGPVAAVGVSASQTLDPVLQTATVQGVGGGPALHGSIRKRRSGKTEAELRAEHYARLYEELEAEAARLDGPENPPAEVQDGQTPADSADDADAESRASTGFSDDAFSRALLARLLALPSDEIRLPVEPFPRIMSKGRAEAIEAARVRAWQIRQDEEAVAALLLASVF